MANNLPPIWPVYNLVIFDCDSTLASIEGIDELARMAESEGREGTEVALSIASLTKRAMEGDIPLEAVYGQRLMAVNPTQQQVRQIAHLYREHTMPHAAQVIAALQAQDVQVFVVSGGLIEPVREFGAWLGVPRQNIYAVDVEYDQLAGKWWRYWDQAGGQNPNANHLAVEANPLTGAQGKNRVIARLRAMHTGRAMLIGDGLSDLEASDEVDLFVGFGGAVYRPRVADASPIYIHTASLSPVLPLALGQVGLSPAWAQLWAEGLRRIQAGEVSFQDLGLRSNFLSAVRRATSMNPGGVG